LAIFLGHPEGIIMAFAVKRDAPSVAPARFEYTLEDGGRERGGVRRKKTALLGQKL
jgi:hypothetical protein